MTIANKTSRENRMGASAGWQEHQRPLHTSRFVIARAWKRGQRRSHAPLLLREPPQAHLGSPARIDIPGIVHPHAFRPSELGRGLGNESDDLAVLDAANPDALLE